MTVSISNKGDKTQMEEVAGEVRSSRHQPRTRRRVRVCAGCSTCAGKPECNRNIGGVVVCGVGHPIVKCEGSSCSTVQGMHGEAGKSSERLVSARQGGDEVTSTRGRCDQGACRKEREGARETKKEEVEEERTTQDEEEKGTQVAEEARAAEAQEALNIFFHKDCVGFEWRSAKGHSPRVC